MSGIVAKHPKPRQLDIAKITRSPVFRIIEQLNYVFITPSPVIDFQQLCEDGSSFGEASAIREKIAGLSCRRNKRLAERLQTYVFRLGAAAEFRQQLGKLKFWIVPIGAFGIRAFL